MIRPFLGGIILAAFAFPVAASSPEIAANPRALPMQFSWHQEKSAAACGSACRSWISASGMVMADTPRQFEAFMRDREAGPAVVVLDSDGGSVHGALALGRSIRRLGLSTTVGRTVDRKPFDDAPAQTMVSPRADCQSMCAFVLLGGVRREVPQEGRVLVHQIWLGDRRDDATAASYSAEDLVLVQRDIGKLVQYTAEMGGDNELLELALKIPPWEPMRALTREELQRTHLDMAREPVDQPLLSSAASAPAIVPVADEKRAEQGKAGWQMTENAGRATLSRRHPLTFEGERIGTFDLVVGCGDKPGSYLLSYAETRFGSSSQGLPETLKQIDVVLESAVVPLKIMSSDTSGVRQRRLDTVATASVSAEQVKWFAAGASSSVTVETTSKGNPPIVIRIGNTGFGRNVARLDTACSLGQRVQRDTQARLDPKIEGATISDAALTAKP